MNHPLPEWEEIHAYLDGALSPTAQQAFSERLAADATLAAAVATEQTVRLALRARLRRTQAPATLHAQVQRALIPASAPTRRQRWWAWLSTPQPIRPVIGVAYTLLWLCLLSGVVWWLEQPVDDALAALELLFRRHELYFEQQPALDVTGNADQIRVWVAARLAHPVQAPQINHEWQLKGARIDEFQQQSIAHFLYMRGNGQRTSLTALPGHPFPLPATAPIRYAHQDFWLHDNGVHYAIVWRTATQTHILIGDIEVPLDELLTLATTARAQLP